MIPDDPRWNSWETHPTKTAKIRRLASVSRPQAPLVALACHRCGSGFLRLVDSAAKSNIVQKHLAQENIEKYEHIWEKKHMENMDKYLVGGFNPSEKYEFVSWDDDIPN